MTGLNWLMGFQHFPLDNWITNGNAYTNDKNFFPRKNEKLK
jgi:hypothetical protein